MTGAADRPSRTQLAACLLATYLIWGTTYLAIRFALQGMAPLFLMATRFLVAGGLLAAWLALHRAPWPTLRQWRNSAAIGILLLGGGMGGVATAEQWIGSGATTVMVGATPLFAGVCAAWFGQRPRRLEWVAILIGSLGVVVLATGGEFRAHPWGSVAILFALGCWSFGSQWSRQLDLPEGAIAFAAEMLTGGLALLVASALVGESWHIAPAARPLAAWAYLVVFGSLIGYSAYMVLVRHCSAALASSYAYANPPVALLMAATLGGETIAPQTLMALPLILGAVAMLAWLASRDAATPG